MLSKIKKISIAVLVSFAVALLGLCGCKKSKAPCVVALRSRFVQPARQVRGYKERLNNLMDEEEAERQRRINEIFKQ